MSLRFQTERYPAIADELGPLLVQNWEETALDHDQIPLDPSYDAYIQADSRQQLNITTARADGKLVGYFINFVVPHPHYKSTLFGMMDIYFLEKEHRNATNGIRLFVAAEANLMAAGAVEWIANTKIGHDVSAIFERLAWRRTAITFTKLLRAS